MASVGKPEFVIITANQSQAGNPELTSWLPTPMREITDNGQTPK